MSCEGEAQGCVSLTHWKGWLEAVNRCRYNPRTTRAAAWPPSAGTMAWLVLIATVLAGLKCSCQILQRSTNAGMEALMNKTRQIVVVGSALLETVWAIGASYVAALLPPPGPSGRCIKCRYAPH